MRIDDTYLTVQYTDVLPAFRHRQVKQLLYRKDIGMLHTHHGHIIQAVKVW
jgi:hypothetical protein